jgi:acetyl/propionyl-CoA carboxylase alpha subunit
MFRRILVANRGEIAVRVMRTCREMGIETVAIYSDADAGAMHVALANRAVRVGTAVAADSYLRIDRILEAAREAGADAVHPGYGFLSESAPFAAACAEAGITFIGPPPRALELMGSKVNARRVAAEAGAPVVPGETPDDQSDAAIASAVRRVGLPALIKPAAGGGGIGMKRILDESSIAAAIAQARREAAAAFGDGTLYVERLIERPRHVEIQLLADSYGQVIHLFERECSLQRRHQKVLEESPSTALTPALRRRMSEAAVAIGRAAGYENAGTVEFLLEGTGESARFYFLEMNTRLQVEHPVTEAVTGLDLVRAQVTIAAGQPLPWAQEALAQRGHAIEVRIYAEDPARDYLPQAGPLLLYREPSMPGIRIDTGVAEGGEIGVHYDPLVAKLVAFGETRDAARRRALQALRSFPILGLTTNLTLLARILEHPRFVSGDLDTGFLDSERDSLVVPSDIPPEAIAVADAARKRAASAGASLESHGGPAPADPWTTLDGRF